MSTLHDAVRLERAQTALAATKHLRTEPALRARLEQLLDAITGIQSTDDPGAGYTQALRYLWAETAKIEARLAALRKPGIE